MNKQELVQTLAIREEITFTKAESIVGSIFDEISGALAEGIDVKLKGFGTFLCAVRKEKLGRNPRTGKSITIPETVVPKFRASQELKDLVR